MSEYVLDHHLEGEGERLALMSELLDPMDRRHIEALDIVNDQISVGHVVICSVGSNFPRATFPRIYSDRDCSRGLHTDDDAAAGSAEPERGACRQTAAALAGWLQ